MLRTSTHLLVSGFMGTGKSTIGREVASRAGATFVDLDEAIEAQNGRSIEAIFAEDGEAGFRALEAKALDAELDAEGPRVVALGGGALLDASRRRAALGRARVVTLTARRATLERRLAQDDTPRPLLAGDRRARIRELLDARSAAYAEAHAQVPTDDRRPADIATTVARIWQDPAIAVPLGARSYAVRVARDATTAVAELLESLAPSSLFLVTDTNVAAAVGKDLEAAFGPRGLRIAGTIALPPGEEHKHLGAVEHALLTMVTMGADRDAVVIAQGGGVVSDVAGFAAATLLRGVRWIVVPTTLLSMVDASVGGKTGVDLGPSKNGVGAFHQPSGVVVGPHYVKTQSARDYTSGLAEVVKTAALGDPELFELLETETEKIRARDPEIVTTLAARAIAVKAAIVTRDERESGERALLNFGHTLGHALEAQGQYVRLTHGEAVSLGIVAALEVGVRMGLTDEALARRVTTLLGRLGLPTDLDDQPVGDAVPFLALDKKRKRGKARFVVLRDLGRATLEELTFEALVGLLGGGISA